MDRELSGLVCRELAAREFHGDLIDVITIRPGGIIVGVTECRSGSKSSGPIISE